MSGGTRLCSATMKLLIQGHRMTQQAVKLLHRDRAAIPAKDFVYLSGKS